MSGPEEQLYLYHEKQVAALCGQHCLNTLLQGPYFSEIDLAQIAQELDALEQSFMAESGMDTESYRHWQQEASGNVAADGMFSIQVLSKALANWDLTCTNLDSPEASHCREQPEHQDAFICNLQEHWLTVRRVGSGWYNFNSLFSAPEYLGMLYLTTFLATLREQGYSIFVVQGQLPHRHPDAGSADSPGRWFTPEEAKLATKEAANAREMGYLKAATHNLLDKASETGTMMTLRAPGQSVGWKRDRESSSAEWNGQEDDADLAQAIAASLRGSNGGRGGQGESIDYDGVGPSGVEDEDLAAAIAASMASNSTQPLDVALGTMESSSSAKGEDLLDPGPEPDAGPGVLTLAIRRMDGTRCVRKFRSTDSVRFVLNFLSSEGTQTAGLGLAMFPSKLIEDDGQTLEAAGVRDKETLTLRKRHP